MTRRRRGALCAVFLAAAGCEAGPEPLASSDLAASGLGDGVKAETPYEEISMHAGRIDRLPLSRVFHGRRGQAGPHTMQFRARCAGFWPSPATCDPAMIVVADSFGAKKVLYGNDDPGAGLHSMNARVVHATLAELTSYDVIVYSHLQRATSKVVVEYSLNGTSWSTAGFVTPNGQPIGDATQIVGGTLIGLGVVEPGDDVQTRTPDDGAGAQSGTRLYVFDPKGNRFAFVDGATSGDKDPFFGFDSSWQQAWVLAAKDTLEPAAGPRGIEVYADLVAGPVGVLETVVGAGAPDCVGTTVANATWRNSCTLPGQVLPPGRHEVYVYAHTDGAGVGKVLPGGEFPAADIGDTGNCTSRPRGRANDLGFTVSVLRDGETLSTRHIPRGAIGSDGFDDPADPGDSPWDRFAVPISVPDDGTAHSYAVKITGNAVRVRGAWGHARNPEHTEVRVATLNIEPHADDSQTDNMMKNTADLLGTRADYQSSGEIFDRATRGQWHWETDVIALQEIEGLGPTVTLQERLKARSGLAWSRKFSVGTWKDAQWPEGNYESYAPVLANEQVRPSGDIWFSDQDLAAADCTSLAEFGQSSPACFLSYQADGDWTWSEYHYMVPIRTQAKRVRGSGGGHHVRPVAVMNWYLNDGSATLRRTGAELMIEKIKKLIVADPTAFNVDGNPSPKWRGNRFIVLGDSNMYNMQCAEGNETLARLRAEFGYAVDVSMAELDWFHRTMDMHYSGAPITDPQQGKYGNCESTTWAEIPAGWNGKPTGCPYHFKARGSWQDDPSAPHADDPSIETAQKYAVDPSQWYAWWAGTQSGGIGSSRHDVIILVGRGWAYDDPVQRVSTLSDVNFRSILNDYLGGGVEILWPGNKELGLDLDCNYDNPPDLVTVPGSYDPAFALTGQSTGVGQPVICSDHKPVGARLRVSFAR